MFLHFLNFVDFSHFFIFIYIDKNNTHSLDLIDEFLAIIHFYRYAFTTRVWFLPSMSFNFILNSSYTSISLYQLSSISVLAYSLVATTVPTTLVTLPSSFYARFCLIAGSSRMRTWHAYYTCCWVWLWSNKISWRNVTIIRKIMHPQHAKPHKCAYIHSPVPVRPELCWFCFVGRLMEKNTCLFITTSPSCAPPLFISVNSTIIWISSLTNHQR